MTEICVDGMGWRAYDLVTNLPSTVNVSVSVMVYGSRPNHKRDCTDITLASPNPVAVTTTSTPHPLN